MTVVVTEVPFAVGVASARVGVGVNRVGMRFSCVEVLADTIGEPWIPSTVDVVSTAGGTAGLQDWIKNITMGIRIRLFRTI